MAIFMFLLSENAPLLHPAARQCESTSINDIFAGIVPTYLIYFYLLLSCTCFINDTTIHVIFMKEVATKCC